MSQPINDSSIAEQCPIELRGDADRRSRVDKESDLAETGRLETLCDGIFGIRDFHLYGRLLCVDEQGRALRPTNSERAEAFGSSRSFGSAESPAMIGI